MDQVTKVREIDKDFRLRKFLSTNEGRGISAIIRGAVFRHLKEVLEYRMPVEKSEFDQAERLHVVSMVELAATEFIALKEREIEKESGDKLRIV